MGRTELALGELGDISYTPIRKNGKLVGYRARGRWRRPTDGEIKEREKSGSSKSAAKSALKRYVETLNEQTTGSAEITRDTKIPALADLWLAECELDEEMSGGTVDRYRQEINPTQPRTRKDGSPDRRVKEDSYKIKTVFANISVGELTAPRYSAYEKTILATGNRTKARLQRVVVKGMMDLAVRHGAIRPGDHPVQSLKAIRQNREKPRALEQAQLAELRDQLRRWLRGEPIPGTPGNMKGPPRNPDIVRICDLMLATGARPGEALGLRRCDVHRPELVGDPWVVDIFGTVLPYRKAGEGIRRQAHTKTGEFGKRSVLLPRFAVSVLAEIGAHHWAPDDESPVFPNRDGGWRSPANFRTTWREARGDRFAWVTPKTFRKTVATVIAAEYGADRAGAQLGHREGSKVTALHYIDRSRLAPDSTPALEAFAGGAEEEL